MHGSEQSKEKKLTIGLVGTGGMGKVHYANYREIKDCEVVAVCGTSPAEREMAETWNLPRFDTISQMLDAMPVDVVDICTPTYTHHDLAMMSLLRGVSTIVEKPASLTAADADELFETAQAHHCFLYIAHVLQFSKDVQKLRELVRQKTFGEPLTATFERLSACPGWAKDGWLFRKDQSGLLPFDLHIHDLDVIVSLFGKPASFTCNIAKRSGISYPEDLKILYTYDNMNVSAEAAWFHADIPFTARWRVCFENAVVTNEGGRMIAYRPGADPIEYDIHDEVIVSTGINVPPCGMYYYELKHFLDCIRRGEPTPYVTRRQIIDVLKILEQIEKMI